jgi:hypothetical protein
MMAGNMVSGAQNKISRLAYTGGVILFFLPVFEPFLPLMFTLAGSIVLGRPNTIRTVTRRIQHGNSTGPKK